MRYRKLMQNIMGELAEYKNDIDDLAKAYLAARKKRDERIEMMRGKYTDAYIEEYSEKSKLFEDCKRSVYTSREKHKKNAFGYLEEIQSEINNYFCAPVSPDFAATITAIKNLDVTLNNKELEVLQGASGGYWDRRLLNELGVSRSKPEHRAVLDEGKLKRVKMEAKDPYTGTDLPDIEKTYDGYHHVKSAVNVAYEYYCGEGNALKDILFPVSETQKKRAEVIKGEYGVEIQEPQRSPMDTINIANAPKYFNDNWEGYVKFLDLMDAISATMPEPEKKTSLSDEDLELIDTLIDPNLPITARDRAVKIAKADKRMEEILRLDKRYKAAIIKELGG